MDVVNKNRWYKSKTILLLQTLVPVITSKNLVMFWKNSQCQLAVCHVNDMSRESCMRIRILRCEPILMDTLREAGAKLWRCIGRTPEIVITLISCFQLVFQLFKIIWPGSCSLRDLRKDLFHWTTNLYLRGCRQVWKPLRKIHTKKFFLATRVSGNFRGKGTRLLGWFSD